MKQNKTKLGIVTLMTTAIVCFIVAILGFVGLPNNNVSAENTPTTYYMLTSSNHDDGFIWSTKEAPAEGATKVMVTFKTISRDIAGRHARVRVSEDGTSFTGNALAGAIQWNDSYAPVGQTVYYNADLVNKSWAHNGSNGISDVDTYNYSIDAKYFGVTIYKGNGGNTGVTGLYEITAVDDTGKDLGITTNAKAGVIITTDKIYTVTLNPNNGAETSKSFVATGSVLNVANPVYDGYAFSGWYTDAELTTKYDVTQGVSSDLNLYAKWTSLENVTARTATLSGPDDGARKTVFIQTRLPRSEDATKVYIEYVLTNDNLVGNTANLLALTYPQGAGKWEYKGIGLGDNTNVLQANNGGLYTASYKITYDLQTNGITWYRGTTELINSAYDVVLADMEKFGLMLQPSPVGDVITFKIYDDMGKDLGITTNTPESVTIEYPQVTFEADNGSEASFVRVEGTTVAQPTAPTKDGYKFIGWFDGDIEYDFTKEVSQDITLTAKWAKVERIYSALGDGTKSIYTKEAPAQGATKVYFVYEPETLYGNGSGGSFGLSAYNGSKSSTINYGSSSWFNSQFAMTGYVFTLTVDLNTSYAELKTQNGIERRSGTFEVDLTEYNQFGVWVNGIAGVSFTWKVHAYDDTGKDLGFECVDGTWNKHDYTVSYVTNSDTVINPVGVESGATYTPIVPTKEGEIFIGWKYTDSDEFEVYKHADFSIDSVNENITLTAVFVDLDVFGASIKVLGTKGLRFGAEISAESKAMLEGLGVEVSYGIRLTNDELGYLDIPCVNWFNVEQTQYTAVLTDAEENYATTVFTAKAYVVIDGVRYYSQGLDRSMAYVANELVSVEGAINEYSDESWAYLTNLANQYVAE